ncbi:S8 family peptidase [Hymenobacter sp. BT175]|uniref:S8 family peptidase n=1 Tax=Hymenobacter translucens TaxID=2886507 RepID=UPI001D0E17A9|nr:S8 family peptidase [Hymenobacter translucens]MCC2548635.1 S8 family peptidase [Hymenobacter translucens]
MKHLLPSLLVVLTLLGVSGALLPATAQDLPGKPAVSPVQPGTLVLKLRPELLSAAPDRTGVAALDAELRRLGAVRTQQKFPRAVPPSREQPGSVELRTIYQVWFGPQVSLAAARAALLKTGTLLYAEPMYVRAPLYLPNDPLADSTLSIPNGQYHLKTIRAYQAWDVTKGDTAMVIGVTDTGTSFTHEDLRNQVKRNYADPIDGIDNDNDGYVDNFRGWDLADRDNDPTLNTLIFQPLHGSLVAGAAAAETDNGRGIAGVGFKCRYLPLKIYPNTPTGSFAGYEAIVYAADHGCQVINASWGGPGGRSEFEQDAITYAAINRNAVVVAAAGNTNAELDFYPASYDHVLSVTSSAPTDLKSGYSTYSYRVSLSAPGELVMTTVGNFDTSYEPVGGTSFSAPLVAGAAALVRVRFPQFNSAQVAAQLRQTADDIYGRGSNATFRDKIGTGRLNVFRAVSLTDRREARVVSSTFAPAKKAYAPGDTLRITVDVQNLLQPVTNLTVTATSLSPHLTVRQGTFNVGSLATLGRAANTTAPFRLAVAANAPLNTRAVLRYRFTAANGYQSDQFVTIILNPDYVVMNAGDLSLTVTSRGNLGYDALGSDLGESVTYKGSAPLLYEGGLMVATSPTRVADRVRNDRNSFDRDFYSQSQIAFRSPLRADQEAAGAFQDSLPALTRNRSVGVRIRQRAYAWATAPHRDYVIVEYQLKNSTPDTLRPLYAGLYMDWDVVPEASRNAAAWDSVRNMGYVYDRVNATTYAAVKLLKGGAPVCYSMDNNAPTGAPVRLRDGFSNAEKFITLSSGTQQRTAGASAGVDVSQVVGAAIGRLAPGDSTVVAFAVLGANSLPALQAAATAAQTRYNAVLASRPAVAETMWQVYPNPARGQLRVEVPVSFAARELWLVNTLGQTVRQSAVSSATTLLNLQGLAAGVYVVQVRSSGATLTRRIVVQP